MTLGLVKRRTGELSATHFICLRSERDKLVYFGHGVVIHFIIHQKSTNFATKLTQSEEIRDFDYLVNSLAITSQKDSSKFATIAVHFVDN